MNNSKPIPEIPKAIQAQLEEKIRPYYSRASFIAGAIELYGILYEDLEALRKEVEEYREAFEKGGIRP